jgi:hypothetical protein
VRRLLLGLGVAALACWSSPPAQSAGISVVAGPGGASAGRYLTPIVVIAPGQDVALVNTDIYWHDLVSDEVGPDDREWCTPLDPSKPEGPANPRRYPIGQCPLFWAQGTLPLGGSTPVYGLDGVAPGRVYAFHCTLVAGMTGNFIVQPQPSQQLSQRPSQQGA